MIVWFANDLRRNCLDKKEDKSSMLLSQSINKNLHSKDLVEISENLTLRYNLFKPHIALNIENLN